jgi:signal peptidase I
MSDLKTGLESIAEAGVAGIALLPIHEPRARRRKRGRSLVGAMAGVCIVVAAVVVAVSVRTPERQVPRPSGESKLVANASYRVLSEGMSPTLQVGDIVSGATRFGAIERGDVLRIRFRQPGEVVEGRNGHIFVDGQELAEPYVTERTSDFPRTAVPRDSYFLLGDNRPNSADSRVWGAVNRSEVIAIALRITAPADRAGAIAGSSR